MRRPTRSERVALSASKLTKLLLTAFVLLSSYVAPDAAAQRVSRTAAGPSQRQGRKAARQTPSAKSANSAASAAHEYACPMHADVTSKTPGGKCPKCGMKLTKREPSSKSTEEANSGGAATAANAGAATAEVGAMRIPDVAVLDQDGRKLNFYQDLVKGKTVAINFIFTTCTTVCPPLTATFSRVQAELGRAGTKANLISISVDPVTDTPERLKSFSGKFKAEPGWTFVTGGKPEIDSLLRALGGLTADKNDHTPLVLVGNDAAGKWTRTYGLSPPSTIVKIINEAAAARPAAAAAPDGAERQKMAAQSAQYFPNHPLLTQENRQVRFYDDLLKGKIVLINFMFTTCAGVCSPMTANLAKVQSYLGERVGREVRMLSISVDPATDTPETLKAYAARFKAGPGWYFLTGKKENVDWVLYKLGGYAEDKNAHTAVLIIGNEATGEWMKVHSMSKPSDIAAAVLKLAGKGDPPPSR